MVIIVDRDVVEIIDTSIVGVGGASACAEASQKGNRDN
jgi:hypothetical protein